MKIYVASSWRNAKQPPVVGYLRHEGHEVYDFRNPAPGDRGFAWSEIDPNWQKWTVDVYRHQLSHPLAQAGFRRDADALAWCEACVLVLPAGASAHLELGYAIASGKRCAVLALDPCEPELMYLLGAEILSSLQELGAWIGRAELGDATP